MNQPPQRRFGELTGRLLQNGSVDPCRGICPEVGRPGLPAHGRRDWRGTPPGSDLRLGSRSGTIPRIERSAIAPSETLSAARIALRTDGE